MPFQIMKAEKRETTGSPFPDLINNISYVFPRTGIDNSTLVVAADGKFKLPAVSIIGRTAAQIAAKDPWDILNEETDFSDRKEVYLTAYALSNVDGFLKIREECALVKPRSGAEILWYTIDPSIYSVEAIAWIEANYLLIYEA